MNTEHLKRNPDKVKNNLIEINNNLITKESCNIYLPENYIKIGLANLNETISILGIFGIVYNDTYYGVSKANALIITEPSGINYVNIHNDKYFEFHYNKNDVIIKNLNLIKTGTIIYKIYNEIISKGKIPWYLNHQDLCMLFDTALLHGGVNLHADFSLLTLLVSSIARNPNNKSEFYRHFVNNTKDSIEPKYIPLMDVAYNTSNTLSKLLGNNYSQAVTSALVTNTETVENIEKLLLR